MGPAPFYCRGNPESPQKYPLNRLEPGVALQVVVGAVVPGLGVHVQQGLNQLFSPAVLETSRKLNIALDNALVDLERVLGVSSERQLPHHKLVEHDPDRPQIYQFVVLFAKYDFGGHVVRGSNNCVCFVVGRNVFG